MYCVIADAIWVLPAMLLVSLPSLHHHYFVEPAEMADAESLFIELIKARAKRQIVTVIGSLDDVIGIEALYKDRRHRVGVPNSFGHHQLTAFLSWAVLATIPWLVGRADCSLPGFDSPHDAVQERAPTALLFEQSAPAMTKKHAATRYF
jgi:hypothetical protein